MELMTFLKIYRQNVSICFLHKNYQKMRKLNLFITFLLLSGATFAQKTIIVNGGQFGNALENVTLTSYDTQTKTTSIIDTINTSSVQEILIDGNEAYVIAQDSIVKYDLITENRLASTKFAGISTKSLAVLGNELVVSNWYGKSSDNLYIYNKNTLSLVDSVSDVNQGVTSIFIDSGYAYVNQNQSTGAPNYTDTLGLILKIDVANRTVVDTIRVTNYSLDMGQFVANPNGLGFYSINSLSNTITSIDFATNTATNTNFNQNFRITNRSQYQIVDDTAFLRMNEGIGSINLSRLSVIDSLIIDTVVTAFTYDTSAHNFYITQTDFFSYKQGGVYSRSGTKLDTLVVGFSPEVIRMFYNQTVGLAAVFYEEQKSFSVYPNPAKEFIQIDLNQDLSENAELNLYNQQGQLVKSLNHFNNQERIYLNDLERGLYIARLVTKGQVLTQKIILR